MEYTHSDLTSNYVSLQAGLWLHIPIDADVTSSMLNSPMPSLNSNLPQVKSVQYDALQGDFDPFPEDFDGERESHGTSCAGEITMGKGNGICGVGVAYNSFLTGTVVFFSPLTVRSCMMTVIGIRLISNLQGATDIDEAEALSWQNGVIDIYSCSWGPSDSGDVVEGPATVTLRALKEGVTRVCH